MGQELKERVKTLEETMQDFIRRTERGFTRLSIGMADILNRMDDFKEQMQKYREDSAREMKEFKEEMQKSREGSARETKESKEKMQKSRDDSARETNEFKETMERKWGELANRLGTLAEDVVAPNVVPLAHKYFNCSGPPLDFAVRRKKSHSRDRGRIREFDPYAVFEDTVILTETKSTPRIEYLDSFVKAIEQYFEYFPEYAGKKLIPIFASLYVEESILKYATRKNIYVMALKGDSMDILNLNELNKNL